MDDFERKILESAYFNKDILNWLDRVPLLTEESFDTTKDGRTLQSRVFDIPGGDTFGAYAKEYYNGYSSEDGYYDYEN